MYPTPRKEGLLSPSQKKETSYIISTHRERAVGQLVSSAGAQAASQRSSTGTPAVPSIKKSQQVLVPVLVSFFF
jgi:hypothetical protein